MDTLFSLLKYILIGFFGLIAPLVVIAVLFGKRVRKQWEYEAELRDESGREFGEFDIEMSKIEKAETDYTFKAKFKLRHPSVEAGRHIQVYVDDVLVMEGSAAKDGLAWLPQDTVVNALSEARAGQVCRVVYGGVEQFTASLVPD